MTVLDQPAASTPSPEIFFDWRFAAQAVDFAIKRGDPELILRGAAGSGKTLWLCDYFHRMCLAYPGVRMLWIRKSKSRLADSVLATFETEVLPNSGFNPFTTGPARENRGTYVYPNGSEIILQGMDDAGRQRSLQADIIWCNEPTEIGEDDWEELSRSNRPRMNSPCPYQFQIGDINPAPPGHWTEKRCKPFPDRLYPRVRDNGERMAEWLTYPMYEDMQLYNLAELEPGHKTKMIVFCHADNPGYWLIDPWGPSPQGARYISGKLGRMSGHRRARYLEGRPMASQGVVFPEFQRDREGIPWHVIEPFEIPREWPCIVMKDPGRDHPDVTLLMAVSPYFIEFQDKDGRPYRMHKKYFIAESVTGNESDHGRPSTTEEDAHVLDEWDKKWRIVKRLGDPHYMFSATKHSVDGSTIADQMARYGHTFEPAPAAMNEEDIAEQCELIRTHLTTLDKLKKPMIQVFKNCQRLITVGFESYSYRRNSRGEIMTGDDKFEKLNDDEVDALRGGITFNPQFSDYSQMQRKVIYRRKSI